ncbi:MAG: class I SAM-dependent methyltransferase [Pyrinomonadaceae bacterium]
MFFAVRADEITGVPTLEDHCYISGREPRLWTQPELIEDLVQSILDQAKIDATSSVLEVGSASGFIARALAPRVAHYTGVDLAAPALEVAERLQLPNAEFRFSDGGRLPFDDGTFDAAFCYDVFTNFPRFSDGESIIAEMVRVLRPRGRALIGSIPDASKRGAFEARVKQVSEELDQRFGPLPRHGETVPEVRSGSIEPGIVCYYFDPTDFVELGRRLGVKTEVTDIHRRNPYFGYRFNVVYTKPIT